MQKIIFFTFFLQACASGIGQTEKTVQADDVELHYQVIGTGKPVLIINGGPGFSSEGFLPIAKKISALGYQAILYDQRGTGKSTMPVVDSSTITMELMNRDIETIRKDMGFNEWIVFGHSFGGIMANYYASKYPNRVAAMIQSSSGGIDLALLQTAQNNLFSKLQSMEIDSMNYWRGQYRETDSREARRKYNGYLARAYVVNKEHVPTIADRLMQGDLSLNRLVWDDLIRIGYDCKKELSNFDKPTLIIQGKQDIISEELAYKADSVYLNSTIVLLENSGHYGWLDQEKEYLNAISSFLAGLEI